MVSWNSGVNPSCVFCQAPMETREHLLFACTFSSRIWEVLARRLLHRHYTNNFADVLNLLSNSQFKGTIGFSIKLLLQATAHSLWLERNKRRHGELPSTADQLITSLDRFMRNKISSIYLQGQRKYEDGLRIWFDSRG